MITIFAFEARRMWRRRLSLLLPAVPVFLILAIWVGNWFRHPLPGALAWSLILASSAIVFCQAMLSDREGRLDLAFAASRVSTRFPLVRRILLLAVPLALQATIFYSGVRLLGL